LGYVKKSTNKKLGSRKPNLPGDCATGKRES